MIIVRWRQQLDRLLFQSLLPERNDWSTIGTKIHVYDIDIFSNFDLIYGLAKLKYQILINPSFIRTYLGKYLFIRACLPNCWVMLYSTDLSWAFAEWILLIAFRECTTSFASILQTSLSPFFAASFNDFFTFSSSLCIAVKLNNQSSTY